MTGLLVSFEIGQTFSHVQFKRTQWIPTLLDQQCWELLSLGRWKTIRNMALLIFKWLALLVCTWRHSGHVDDDEQNCLSPLGTKSRFHVNSSKHCLLYWPPTWLPYHLTANQAQQPQIMMTFFWVSIEDKISWDTLL